MSARLYGMAKPEAGRLRTKALRSLPNDSISVRHGDLFWRVLMRTEVQHLLQTQAAWQRSRASRPWADKLRDSVAARRGCASIRKQMPAGPAKAGKKVLPRVAEEHARYGDEPQGEPRERE